MKIITSVKCVPDAESLHTEPGRSLNLSDCVWQISPYDMNAIEAAAKLRDSYDDVHIVSLTAGGAAVDDSRRRKDILSRGAEKLFCIRDDSLQGDGADPLYTAAALAAGIKKIGDADIVIFGEGSGDMYAQQTGLMVGVLLGWPVLNAVTGIQIEDGQLIVRRTVESAAEVYRVDMPAVLCVTSDLNTPRFVSVRDTLSAGKKPFETWSLADLDCVPEHGSVSDGVVAPSETSRRCEVYQSMDDEAVAAITEQLKKFL